MGGVLLVDEAVLVVSVGLVFFGVGEESLRL
jgi:hypothetical protein